MSKENCYNHDPAPFSLYNGSKTMSRDIFFLTIKPRLVPDFVQNSPL